MTIKALSQREKDKKSHCATTQCAHIYIYTHLHLHLRTSTWCAHILNASGSSGFHPLHLADIGIRKGSEKGDRDNQMLPALQLVKS